MSTSSFPSALVAGSNAKPRKQYPKNPSYDALLLKISKKRVEEYKTIKKLIFSWKDRFNRVLSLLAATSSVNPLLTSTELAKVYDAGLSYVVAYHVVHAIPEAADFQNAFAELYSAVQRVKSGDGYFADVSHALTASYAAAVAYNQVTKDNGDVVFHVMQAERIAADVEASIASSIARRKMRR
jgi:hypothetical protein